MGGNYHFVRRGSSSSSNLRAARGVWPRAACRDESTTHMSLVSGANEQSCRISDSGGFNQTSRWNFVRVDCMPNAEGEFDSVLKSGKLSADSRRWPV